MQDKYIKLLGINVHYTVSGAGPALIMMHGWGCNTTTLASIQRVADETHTVYNIDIPGFGKSEEPNDVWGVDEYTEMLHEFVQQLGIKDPSLLGHSNGGRIAINYASMYPVSKVILVDSAGVKAQSTGKKTFKTRVYKMGKRCAKLFSKPMEEKITYWLGSRFGSADYRNSSPQMRKIMSKLLNQDLQHVMPKISAPTLLIWGENDTATPLSDAKIMERLIPGAGLVSFPNCGHYSFLDNPVQFAAVLRSFLRA